MDLPSAAILAPARSFTRRVVSRLFGDAQSKVNLQTAKLDRDVRSTRARPEQGTQKERTQGIRSTMAATLTQGAI